MFYFNINDITNIRLIGESIITFKASGVTLGIKRTLHDWEPMVEVFKGKKIVFMEKATNEVQFFWQELIDKHKKQKE